MPKLTTISGLAAAMTIAIVAVATNATPSDAKDGTRFRCKARGAEHTALHGRYEERVRPNRTRQKFNAEFEALPGGSFSAGQQITFLVDSVVVGSAPMVAVAGELNAELELDSNARGNKKPFPGNFPPVSAGTMVEAKVGANILLGCELD